MSDAEEPGISLGFRNKLSAFSFQAPGPSTPRRSPRKSSAREQTVSSRGSVSRTRTPLSPSKRGFAPPEKYSHLHVLQDYLAPVLDSTLLVHASIHAASSQLSTVVFCGIKYNLSHFYNKALTLFCDSPGQKSAEIGHHFGGPTNHFWPCLYESGKHIS
jgi:TDG/mug DNA glycosylase family protein